ncbi:MAG TPA: amylo-alpha-1,6-glucosidase [Candidatus Polarisedimenticolia bacterium]|nr:amylo-alpha-1,6-glucosidase [Candidatus Polarisedimenticolia bacterium]
MNPTEVDGGREWLETDGLGGFASGTVGGVRDRRYHALLLAATRPPTGRFVLVNGLEARVETAAGAGVLQAQRYSPGDLHPAATARLVSFEDEPWPTWRFRLEDGTVVEQQLFVRRGEPSTAISWKRVTGEGPASLAVRPFLSGRDYHALHHENPAFRFAAVQEVPGRVVWQPYDGVPAVQALHNGVYEAQPHWYRGFHYAAEQERGLDHLEDLAAPGLLRFDLAQGEAVLILAAQVPAPGTDAGSALRRLRDAERARRKHFPSRLHRAAEDYVVRRGEGATIVAGYPWFADWGRDTFIALRGLCLATGRLDAAREILVQWAGAVSEGMLPNRFPDQGDEPEYNSVDASLWYVVAVHEYLEASAAAGRAVPRGQRDVLARAVGAIVDGVARGTRYGIRMETDGLLAAGTDGVQLTWMDAKVGEWVVTPRRGKPVEVQALWINALRIASALAGRPEADWRRAAAAFHRRFWNPDLNCLYDVVDVDHRPGEVDDAFRPNQILAVGGLPFPVLAGEVARRVVDAVEARLLTPLGLRSLAEGSAAYAPRYEGGVPERDGSYHQGTVWPWLLGPFVEAWVRVRGGTATAVRQARERFLLPMTAHLADAGLGHVSEIADAEAPHRPRGCPFQAWSVGELLRLSEQVLQPGAARALMLRSGLPGDTGVAFPSPSRSLAHLEHRAHPPEEPTP